MALLVYGVCMCACVGGRECVCECVYACVYLSVCMCMCLYNVCVFATLHTRTDPSSRISSSFKKVRSFYSSSWHTRVVCRRDQIQRDINEAIQF